MLKAIALDDEPIALDIVKNFAAKVYFIDLKACFTDAFKALEYLQQEKADLLFLDIKMPDISGMEFLRSLPDPPMTIFTTAYSEHAVESFELNTLDYLLKPFSFPRFLKACNKALDTWQLKQGRGLPAGAGLPIANSAGIPGVTDAPNPAGASALLPAAAPAPFSLPAAAPPGYVFIKTGYEQVRVSLAEIEYVQSAGNYVQFVLTGQKILSRLTMSEVESLLPAGLFTRVHRSYIVSNAKVSRFDRWNIRVGNIDIPIGQGYAALIGQITKR
jgi:two-component system LytT family response regulator